jgi:hypothetical protein
MKLITVNPQDRDDYYVDWLEDSTGYLLYPYAGGYNYIDCFRVYCKNNDLEHALEILVAYLCKDDDLRETYLRTSHELEDDGVNTEENETWLYIDATMEGADQPYYIDILDMYATELTSPEAKKVLSNLQENKKLNEFYSDVWNAEIDEETLADWQSTGKIEEQIFGEDDIWYSVKLHNNNDDLDYWLDAQYDKYGDLVVEWNQYIFYNNRTDKWRERVQDNIANFNSAEDLVNYEIGRYLASKNKNALKERDYSQSKTRVNRKYNHR